MRGKRESDLVVQQAIEWIVQLNSGEMTDDERNRFEKWRSENAQHELACQKIEQTLGHLQSVPATQSLRRTLNKPSSRRDFLLTLAGFGFFAGTSAWIYDRNTPITGWMADIHTSTGERVTRFLKDGSQIILNARSSVNFNFSDSQREITLIKGQILVNAKESTTPLTIITKDGKVQNNTGSISIAVLAEGTRVASISTLSQLTNSTNTVSILKPGAGLMMGAGGFSAFKINTEAEKSWINGFFEVNDQPLIVLVDALRNYRAGIIRISPEAAKMRVSGIFSLDNTDSTLESLSQTLPLVVTRTTDYWVSISKA